MTHPVHYLLVGLVFGSLFLTLGLFLGLWIAKAFGGSPHPQPPNATNDSSDELIKISLALDSFAKWTKEFASDFSRYQQDINHWTDRAADQTVEYTREDIQKLLGEIISVNGQLKTKLDSAERKLELQTSMLAGFLTEARTDSLTGLANRRAFDQRIEFCYNQWCDTKKLFSLALIDIDHFKSVNDTYGHPVGDQVLREIARHLSRYATEDIHIARYGGEEFSILINRDLSQASEFAEKLRLSIESMTINAEGNQLQLTLSIGVSQILPDDRIGKLVRRSDEALYSAKLAGRNRVFVHDGTNCTVFSKLTVPPSKAKLDEQNSNSASTRLDRNHVQNSTEELAPRENETEAPNPYDVFFEEEQSAALLRNRSSRVNDRINPLSLEQNTPRGNIPDASKDDLQFGLKVLESPPNDDSGPTDIQRQHERLEETPRIRPRAAGTNSAINPFDSNRSEQHTNTTDDVDEMDDNSLETQLRRRIESLLKQVEN